MFRSLAHPQEDCKTALGILRACYVSWLHDSTPILVHPTHITRNIPSAACVAPPEEEQVMLKTCKGP
jgi:hypothetical protein